MLQDLIDVPRKFDLPVAFGFVERKNFPAFELKAKPTAQDLDFGAHAVAFLEACLTIESVMRRCFPQENCLIIAEDRPEVRQHLKHVHQFCRNEEALRKAGIITDLLPFRQIRDTLHFAAKSESRHLQLADACAFFMRGHLARTKHVDPFYTSLKPQMIAHPKSDH
jgi:hypothetical protein